MKKVLVFISISLLAFTGILCKKLSVDFDESKYDQRMSGGAATVFLSNSQAFGSMIPGMSPWDSYIHAVGDKIFSQTFVTAPAPHFGGLGTLYNNVSCIRCHMNDGKGVPTSGSVNSGFLTKLSVPGLGLNGAPLEIPGFGSQLQDKAVSGKTPEAKVQIVYNDKMFTYPDGSKVILRKPDYAITNPYTILPSDYMMSVRLGPPVFGVGLLELIPEATILGFAEAQRADNKGIKGIPNYVWDEETKSIKMGRFGLKANNPTVLMQVAGAFHQDMGITSSLFPIDNSYGQPQFDGMKDDPEITDSILMATVFYVRTLAVPARRDIEDPTVIKGERLFRQLNCSSCHIPETKTGVDVRLAQISNQRIQPFTDLLLHDMGPDLADGRPDFLASGQHWKTPALWGIGLLQRVNQTASFYLHDGRARTIEEAILWHGGEAERSRNDFAQLNAADRKTLIRFLSSL
ncbi:MAG TPA: di-heme oxidoredictase family protein [Edaphocola sp.]|nr:di-heme oxidoredictase family protein [Edaphocola sp.]